MLELKNDTLQFTFPEVHPSAQLGMEFQRTLRIPDDGKQYPLPPGLGAFPLRHVDDFRDRVPAKWLQHGGVMLPMFQSEAMWLNFKSYPIGYGRPAYPFAIKVSAGKVSALTGDDWVNGLRLKDYCVAPHQRWIDGFVTAGGIVRQFVAAALGQGFTAEEQITGKADHGGIQIEIFPMKVEVYNRRFPPREEKTMGGIHPAGLRRGLRGRSSGGGQSVGGDWKGSDVTKGAQSYSADVRIGGVPMHDIASDLSVVCHKAGIVEPITWSLVRFFGREDEAMRDQFIDFALDAAEPALLPRLDIALRQIAGSADKPRAAWASSVRAGRIAPLLTEFMGAYVHA